MINPNVHGYNLVSCYVVIKFVVFVFLTFIYRREATSTYRLQPLSARPL